MAKMGRPKAEKPKVRTIGIRLSEEEYARLKEYAENHKTTVTEVLHSGMYRMLEEKVV